MTPEQAFNEALVVLKPQSVMAEACGTRQQNVSKWKRETGRLPAKYAALVQLATAKRGCEIKAAALAPEAFPPEVELIVKDAA